MGDGYHFETLKAAILARSRATEWPVARLEWKLVDISMADEPETCACGHYPIRELCLLNNRITGQHLEVGNVCVKRFLGLDYGLVFQGLKRIADDDTKALNAAATAFFYERGVISEWEYKFQQSTLRKRQLSLKQEATRQSINARVLAAVRSRGLAR
ncbi:hypothetical protein [Siccirubricoccus phaeus]|uniref:hypothetical protein n=1 Tax=Siccirubricoccus phaeus TaxID=2595053 RepID=UPI0011F2527F|nr:hypothetical protein [Siccirubricoccus phaeus]